MPDMDTKWQTQRTLAVQSSVAFRAMIYDARSDADYDRLRADAVRLERAWFRALVELGYRELPESLFAQGTIY